MFNQLLLLFLNYARYKRGAAYTLPDLISTMMDFKMSEQV